MITAEIATALRAPFLPEEIGKLPRVTCSDCRDRNSTCKTHRRNHCSTCHATVSTAHIHLDYIGHAETTDRLLSVDPEWTWEPAAWGQDGLPQYDRIGGLWIRLTVAGVTRLGYGHADGKSGGDAVKEIIGDAVRNAAMRFGVALDLWRRSEPPEQEARDATASEIRGQIAEMAEAKNYDLSTVDADFTKVMSGADIRTAGVGDLAEYRDRFKDYPDAE